MELSSPRAALPFGLLKLATALAVELRKHRLVELPGALFVGVGERRSRRRALQSEVIEPAFRTGQPTADLAQRLRLDELTKQHRDELRPAAEAARMAFGLVLADSLLKLTTRK